MGVATKTHVLNLLHRLIDGKIIGGPDIHCPLLGHFQCPVPLPGSRCVARDERGAMGQGMFTCTRGDTPQALILLRGPEAYVERYDGLRALSAGGRNAS